MGILQPLPTGPVKPKPGRGQIGPLKPKPPKGGGRKYIPENGNPLDTIRNQVEDLSNQDKLYRTY